MTAEKPKLKLFLDEGVPASAGRALKECGHEVIYLKDAIAPGSPDPLVCAAAEANEAILVAHDADMQKLASRKGFGQRRYRKLSLIKLSCRESKAAQRLTEAITLIEHEWVRGAASSDRRIFIDIGKDVIRTYR